MASQDSNVKCEPVDAKDWQDLEQGLEQSALEKYGAQGVPVSLVSDHSRRLIQISVETQRKPIPFKAPGSKAPSQYERLILKLAGTTKLPSGPKFYMPKVSVTNSGMQTGRRQPLLWLARAIG